MNINCTQNCVGLLEPYTQTVLKYLTKKTKKLKI